MTLHAILASHGYGAPYAPDLERPGTVIDARERPVPFMILPGMMGCQDRREFSRLVADQLNAEASAVAERDAA